MYSLYALNQVQQLSNIEHSEMMNAQHYTPSRTEEIVRKVISGLVGLASRSLAGALSFCLKSSLRRASRTKFSSLCGMRVTPRVAEECSRVTES